MPKLLVTYGMATVGGLGYKICSQSCFFCSFQPKGSNGNVDEQRDLDFVVELIANLVVLLKNISIRNLFWGGLESL